MDDLKAEGVLGLSPFSLLDLMKESGIISQRVISFRLRKPGTPSTFTLGDPPSA